MNYLSTPETKRNGWKPSIAPGRSLVNLRLMNSAEVKYLQGLQLTLMKKFSNGLEEMAKPHITPLAVVPWEPELGL